jgi:serine/threonine protein kinase
VLASRPVSQEAQEDLPADFGKYRLEKRIATGGMAEIFLAHRHDRPLEPLVIKRILPHLSKSTEFVTMFLDEARIAAQLKHVNVVSIEDMGQINGAYYIAMEYVHGEDIRRIYNRAYKLQRSLPLSHSIRVIADAALGLGHAHKLTDLTGTPLGLVHRDVSPQNILVTYEGDAKVVDFGIAKAANKVVQTRAGVLKGKYSYMSPEQALGDGMDHRTDIFALGIILYETTTGTRLFKRQNELATLQAIIKCEFVPPTEALPGYPAELEEVLLKALARRPEDRYDDAEEFSAALYDFLHESGLYVERAQIAEFMKDLFSDRLAEEEGTGEPALPHPEEVKEELGATTADRKKPRTSEPADPVRPHSDGTAQERPPGPDGEDDGDHYTATEGEAEDLALDTEPEPTAEDQRRRGTEVLSRRRAETVPLPDPASQPQGTPADLAPTVAAHPSYRPPARSAVIAPDPPRPQRDQPERAAGTRKPVEPTERVRYREEPADETAAEMSPPKDKPLNARPVLMIGFAAVVLLSAILTGVVMNRTLRQRPDAPIPPVTPMGTRPIASAGTLVIQTEAGAEIFVSGERLGTANAAGEAGPFEIAAGEVLVRVANESVGFERQRPLKLEAGRTYDVELRGRPGWLRLMVAPWAKVIIDDKPYGMTPLPKLPLLEGLHRVVLENPDIGRRYQTSVRVSAGEDAELKVDLKDAGERL